MVTNRPPMPTADERGSPMPTPPDHTSAGLLAEILVEVKGVAAEVSELKVANAQVIAEARHRASQTDDHEARLRALESAGYVTGDEVDETQRERSKRLVGWLTVIVAVVALLETAVIAVVIRT